MNFKQKSDIFKFRCYIANTKNPLTVIERKLNSLSQACKRSKTKYNFSKNYNRYIHLQMFKKIQGCKIRC